MLVSHPLTPVLERQLRALGRHLGPTRDGLAEPLHQSRVATRRLRELLPLADAELSGRLAGRTRRRVRQIGRTLGPVRELDVALELIDALADAGRARPAVVGRIRQRIRTARDDARERLLARLTPAAIAKVERDLAGVTKAVGRRAPTDAWVRALARRLTRRVERLRRAVDVAGHLYVSERVHGVRIAVKQLRYLLEIARVTGLADTADATARLKAVQQRLGRLHDLEMLQSLLGGMELPAERHQLWMGQLTALDTDLVGECRRLHGEFVAAQPSVLAVCLEASTLASRLIAERGGSRSGGRALKMSLETPPRRGAVVTSR